MMNNKIKLEKENLSKIATEQQMNAANPYSSVWVEASAGTGKTKVLSDRVLKILLEKVSPQKILCLTYTKAAAVEMNERVAKKLSFWAICSDEELKDELIELLGKNLYQQNLKELNVFARTLFATLLDTPGGMKIQTIHSFCQEILKKFPLEASISPYFEVMDDRISNEILKKIKIDLLKKSESLENIDISNAIKFLTTNITEYSFPEVMNTITTNRNKIDLLLQKYNFDINLVKYKLSKKLNVDTTLCEADLISEFMNGIDKDEFLFCLKAFENGKKTDVAKFEAFKIIGENSFNSKYFYQYIDIFITQKNEIRDSLATQDVVKKYPEIIELMTKEAQRALDAILKIINLRLLDSTVSVLTIAKEIIKQYNFYKTTKAALDFEDLIVITKKLLENQNVADWVLFKLDGGIEHILIDEAQDTLPNQWAIIKALTADFFAGANNHNAKINRSVFVVGDRKQSIYSFQGADPKEFDKMFNHFNNQCLNFKKIQLDVSFRSTKAVMDCVNTLFEVEEAKKGVIAEGERINHLPYRLGEGGKVEIFPLLKQEKSKEKESYNWLLPVIKEQKTSPSNQLAKMIASNIKKMVDNKEPLESQGRPVRYGDFMFLVQQRKSFVEEFVRACKEIGVNVSGVDKLELLEQIAVQDLISLGSFLLNPYDDLSLAECLKSPIFNLNDDDLFELCYSRKTSLFSMILKNHKYDKLAEQLKSLLNLSGYLRPFELYNHILVNLHGKINFITRIGLEVEDILEEFINLTLTFEQSNTPTLQNFISWINADKVTIKKEMEQGDLDTVKIMTVHGSKGLQAPIVILAETTKIKNKKRQKEFLWDEDDIVYFPTGAKWYDDNCNKIKNNTYDNELDEYRRLLYVALTRAEDRLYIAGFEKSKATRSDSWYKLIANNIKDSDICEKDNDRIVYSVPQSIDVKPKNDKKSKKRIESNCEFLTTPASVENPLAKPYHPSRFVDEDNDTVASPLEENGNYYKRGNVIHKLLQFVFNNATTNNKKDICFSFIKKNLPEFNILEQQKIVDEVLNLYNKYTSLFTLESMAEVPIIGEVNDKIISAKIDRLIIKEDEIIIIDYKTNRNVPTKLSDVPNNYLNQLGLYKELLNKIYPDKKITTYILWTNACNLMEI